MITPTYFNFIVNNFLEHVVVLNNTKEIIFQTNNISSLLGYTNAEVAEKGIQSFFVSPKFSLDEAIEKAKKNGEFLCVENLKHKTESHINIALRILYHERTKDSEPLFLFYLRDNTQQNITRKDIIKKTLTIENLSKSRKIRDGRINEAIYELLESSSRAMQCTRVNAWVFDDEHTQIQCIGNFDARENKLVPQTPLPRFAMPMYFKLFESEKIIIATDALIETKTAEMYPFYLKPHNIQSLMDVPVRIDGEVMGVICFENVGAPREWNLQDQKFGLVAAQILSLTIESHNKQKVKRELEVALEEKNILLQEVNHRVKNNLTIVASLMNLQSEKSNDDFHKQLFLECRNRLDAIAAIHELIYKAKSYSNINFKDYLNQILDHIIESYNSNKLVEINRKIADLNIDISLAISLALIVNELITNAYKHAFINKNKGIIEITLQENNEQVLLMIADNGNGFDKTLAPHNSIGMDILNGLVEQIDGVCNMTTTEQGTEFKISFSKK